MKIRSLILAGAALAVLSGCQSSPTASVGGSSTGNGTPKGPVVASATGDTAPAAQTPAPPVPDDLKSDAYHWYGLANDKPMNLEVTVSGGASYVGTQTIHGKSVADGKAVFEVERTGELETQLGTETLSLEKDGIFTTASTLIKGAVRNEELPAKIAPGLTWQDSGNFNMNSGQHFEQNQTLKVVGEQTVQTKKGSEAALLITGAGQMKIDKASYRIESKSWYVKDRGLVKNVITMKSLSDPKAKPQEITIQETR